MNYPKGISVPKSAQLVIDRFRPRCTAGLLPMLATALKRSIVRKWAWCCTWYVLWALEEPKLQGAWIDKPHRRRPMASEIGTKAEWKSAGRLSRSNLEPRQVDFLTRGPAGQSRSGAEQAKCVKSCKETREPVEQD
jgi:hypothetical protein